ncbi:MAG: serine hydrolase [Anaerolineae bacterium]|nr:serine hydrolase [Anaerolineae bacterium]
MNHQVGAVTLRTTRPERVGIDPDRLQVVESVVREGVGAVYPSATLLVAVDGCVVLHRAYGVLDPETQARRADLDTLYDLASVTKLYTATAFMTLVEAGRVALETPVAEVLPAFGGTRPIGPVEDPVTQAPLPPDPAYAGREVDTSEVTFKHLLTHTSGLPAWRSLFRMEGNADETPPLPHQVPSAARARRIAFICQGCDFAYPPGARMTYSDLGLILLGEATARLAGSTLAAYVQRAVLDPLGLAHTTYNPLAHGVPAEAIAPTEFCAWRGRRCVGEVHDENAAGLGGVAGHAGLFSTAWEVGILAQTYLNGGAYGAARILSPGTVAEMTRVQVNVDDNPRGLGWVLRSQAGSSSGRWFGPRSYGHTGYTGTSVWVDPDRRMVVVLLSNRVYGGRDPAGIAALRPRVHDAVVEAVT